MARLWRDYTRGSRKIEVKSRNAEMPYTFGVARPTRLALSVLVLFFLSKCKAPEIQSGSV